MSLNFIWKNDKWYNKRVLIWRFTLVLIKINYGQIGDQTGLFYTTHPVFIPVEIDLSVVPARLVISDFFTCLVTVIQDLLVRRQFSLVPDNRTNVNVEAWLHACLLVPTWLMAKIMLCFFRNISEWIKFLLFFGSGKLSSMMLILLSELSRVLIQ